MENMNLLILALLLLLTSACSTLAPQPAAGSRSITPNQLSRHMRSPESAPVEWGGVIVSLENLSNTTELEIIAYPLTHSGQPDTDEPPEGRFIAVNGGYLERADYARGRQVTVSGRIDRLRKGKVGQADYLFPVLLTQEIRLWPKEYGSSLTPRFNFGFGFGSGGSRSGGVGVGIGF